MKSGSRSLACLTGMLLCFDVAFADGMVVLDFSGLSDSPTGVVVGQDDRLHVQSRLAEREDACGLFGLDSAGNLLGSFGSAGRLSLQPCAADFVSRPGGALASIGRSSFALRDASGAATASVALSLPHPATPPGSPPQLQLVRPLANGGFVVGGSSRLCTRCNEFYVGRLNADGSPDLTFSGDGFVAFSIDGRGEQYLASIHPLNDGKIIASGVAIRGGGLPGDRNTQVVRFNVDGTQDFSFGANGRVDLDDGSGISLLDSQGRILVLTNSGVKRVLADGSLDASYAGPAIAEDPQSVVILDSQDRLLTFTGIASQGARVQRYDNAGVLDANFNGSGTTIVTFPHAVYDDGCTGAIQSGDRPVIACRVREAGAGRSNLAVARLTAAGALDVTFGVNVTDADTFPDSMTLPPVTVPYGAVNVVSSSVTVAGITEFSSISGSNYSLGCNGSWAQIGSEVQTISAGQTVCVRANASATPGGTSSHSVNIGGQTVVFTLNSTNSPADSVPDSFAFTTQTGVATNTVVTSNSITVSGIEGYTTATVTGGEFSIGCTSTFTQQSSSVISAGQTICVRHTSAAAASTNTTTTLTLGGISGTFTSTTAAPPPPPPPPPSSSSSSGGSSSGGGAIGWLPLALLVPLVLAATRRRQVKLQAV